MSTNQQNEPVDLDGTSEQDEPVDDQVDGPARYALYDARISTDLLANQQQRDITSEENSYPSELIVEEQWRKKKSRLSIGVTYTRLGSDSCRSGAELVYKGVVAGSLHNQKGGGSNYLCLPEDPEYSTTFKSGVQGDSTLYGTEYYINAKLSPKAAQYHNIPCAVCYTPKRSSTIMIPALINCPKSYTKEYDGFLMSNHKSFYRTEFVCVDKEMEVARGTHTHTNGAYMNPVEVDCNSGIDCSPYQGDNELTCVVCSR